MKFNSHHDDPLEGLRSNYDAILEYVVIAKAIDEDDNIVLAMGATGTLSNWELIGMLRAAINSYEHDLQDEIDGE